MSQPNKQSVEQIAIEVQDRILKAIQDIMTENIQEGMIDAGVGPDGDNDEDKVDEVFDEVYGKVKAYIVKEL